jgi:eukaryotic-like serine/threonine-protein kinase
MHWPQKKLEQSIQETTMTTITTSANLTFNTFENSTYGIKMIFPSNWNKEQNLSEGGSNYGKLVDIVRFSPPFENNNSDKSSENLDIKVDNISDIQPVTLGKYTNDSIEYLGKDFKIIWFDENATISGGTPAYELEYTGIEQDVNLNAMIVFTMKDDKAYIISYMAEPSRYSSDLPNVQKMINSIELFK